MKGQFALEQMMMTALGLTFISTVVAVAFGLTMDSVRVAQAQDMVNTLVQSADYVDSLGPLSQDKVDVFVPEGLESLEVEDDRVLMRVSLSSGDADIYAHANTRMFGEISPVPGPQEVTISATPDGRIRFGEAALLCLPATITRTFAQGDMGNDSFTVTNVGGHRVTDITVSLAGNINDILAITPPAGELNVGESDAVGLDFDVPAGKEQGIYEGWITVTGSNNTQCSTAVTITLFVVRPGGPDNEGPVVTDLVHIPWNPTKSTPITINATGDDSNTGNSTIALCQLELDYSGIWEDMPAADGVYDEIVEEVEFDLGLMGRGWHTVRVRCIDSELNIGEPETTRFSVNQMLFISVTSALDTPERRWTEWMDNHTSSLGLSWGYDLHEVANVTGGQVDIYDYDAVIMADAPNTAPGLYSILNDYRNSGGYVIVLAEGMKFALKQMGASASNSQSRTENNLEVLEEHYVTQGYSVGSTYAVTTGNDPIYYNEGFAGEEVASLGGSSAWATVLDGQNIITYGVTKPAAHTADGDIFATHVIDYGVGRGRGR